MSGWDNAGGPRVELAIPHSHLGIHLTHREIKRFWVVTFWFLTALEVLAVFHMLNQKDVMGATAMFAYLSKEGLGSLLQRLFGIGE